MNARRLVAALHVAVWLAIAAVAPAHANQRRPRPAAGLGISDDVQYLRGTALERRLRGYDALGVDRVRFQVQWSAIEPRRGVFRWRGVDRVVARLHARGFRTLAVLQTTPRWARVAGCDDLLCRPASARAYAAFARRAARRYAGRIDAWEVWNEPNNPLFFKPDPDPAAYAGLLRAAYPAIKAGDPRATVVSAGLAPGDPVAFLSDVYAAGAGGSFDAVGIHPYTFPALPLTAGPDSVWARLDGGMPSLRAVMRANGDRRKRLWATEFGAPTGPAGNGRAVSEDLQAQMISAGHAAWSAHAWAGPMMVWTYMDWRSGDENGTFGLVRRDGSRKPSFATFRAIARR